MQKRIDAIDIARGLGILSIIAVHSTYIPFSSFTEPFVSPWMLVVFPFIGGYLHNNYSSFGTFVKKKAKSLLLPYLFFITTTFGLWLFIKDTYPNRLLLLPVTTALKNIALGNDLLWNGPLWFLPCYFFSLNIAFLTSPLWKRNILFGLLLIVCSPLLALKFNDVYHRVPYSLDLSLLFCGFFIAGYYVKKTRLLLRGKWFILVLGAFILSYVVNGEINIYAHAFHTIFLFWTSAFLGSWFIVSISYQLAHLKNRILSALSYFGRNSIFVLAIHWPVMQWLTYILVSSHFFMFKNGEVGLVYYRLQHTANFHLYTYILFTLYFSLSLFVSLLFIVLSKKVDKSRQIYP